MIKYLLLRVLQAIVTMLVVTVLVFVLSHASGDPAELFLTGDSTDEDRAAVRRFLGTDRPVMVQYGLFLGHLVQGDFGTSVRWRRPALEVLLPRVPNSARLALAAMAFAALVGLPLGILSAISRDTVYDRFAMGLAVFGQAVPSFFIGILLILAFVITLRWFTLDPSRWTSMVLPAVALGLFPLASLARIARSAMLDVLDAEYVKLARIKGLPERVVIVKHAVKNALIPILTVAALQFVGLINGAIVVEQVFNWQGVGQIAVQAVQARDFVLTQTVVIFASFMFITANLVVDVLYAYIDPRIRYA